ncbi:outer membrane beta-barrel protein [Hymenobacter lucidus]|uniref:Porin family protein n=1 Tax=Hymenobacter lucidus TaxID=2880930 RepID=A0ABS8ASU5_9BACT|nr:outer membrane beta-barrel protein [Hymenobacter lucidus]MCB2409285.1 porin family protein [Hymenobacter lucidus]
MKKLFTTSALVFTSIAGAFAQTEQGSLLVGSSISQLTYATSADGGRKDFTLGVTPTVGFFVANRLAVGAEINLAYVSTNASYGNGGFKGKGLEYGLAPFARYYVLDAPKHKFFGQASYGIAGYSGKSESYDGGYSQTNKGSYWSGSVGVGYNYFISPMVALEVQPYYRRTSTDLEDDIRKNRWGVSVGFQIFFPKTAAAAQ